MLVSRHDIADIWVAFFEECPQFCCGQADMFDSSPTQQGTIIFAATLSSVIGSFAIAGLENLMLSTMGLSLLSVRKINGSLGCVLQSSSMLLFGASRSPTQAIATYSLRTPNNQPALANGRMGN